MGIMFTSISYSQNNLVPNPSFESYSTCPNNGGQIIKAIPWFQPYTPGSSTDYYNSCATNALLSVPANSLGLQFAKTGDGYAGFQTWSGTFDIREYLEVELTDSLIQGTQYCVSFYVSLPEGFGCGTDGVGAYFSQNPVYYASPFFGVLPLQPQMENPSGNVIIDTTEWTLVSGSFVANGGEKFMTIGNFKNDSATDTVAVKSWGANQSYFYIEDVSVVQGSCAIDVSENYIEETMLIVYPNPTKGVIHFSALEYANTLIEVFDTSGRIALVEKSNGEIDVGNLENGFYTLKITYQTKEIVYERVILNK